MITHPSPPHPPAHSLVTPPQHRGGDATPQHPPYWFYFRTIFTTLETLRSIPPSLETPAARYPAAGEGGGGGGGGIPARLWLGQPRHLRRRAAPLSLLDPPRRGSKLFLTHNFYRSAGSYDFSLFLPGRLLIPPPNMENENRSSSYVEAKAAAPSTQAHDDGQVVDRFISTDVLNNSHHLSDIHQPGHVPARRRRRHTEVFQWLTTKPKSDELGDDKHPYQLWQRHRRRRNRQKTAKNSALESLMEHGSSLFGVKPDQLLNPNDLKLLLEEYTDEVRVTPACEHSPLEPPFPVLIPANPTPYSRALHPKPPLAFSLVIKIFLNVKGCFRGQHAVPVGFHAQGCRGPDPRRRSVPIHQTCCPGEERRVQPQSQLLAGQTRVPLQPWQLVSDNPSYHSTVTYYVPR